jgi:hypothetical protein
MHRMVSRQRSEIDVLPPKHSTVWNDLNRFRDNIPETRAKVLVSVE